MDYSKKVMELFMKPHNVGEIKDADGIGKVGNVVCGDLMWVYIKVKDKKIADIKYKTLGCVAAIASSEALCSIVKGKTIDQALKITKTDIIKFMGGKIPAVKIHCSILASEALKKAIDNYRNK